MVHAWMPAVIVNAFAILILLILLVDIGQKQRRFRLRDQKLFQWMLVNNIVILILDAGTWVLNGQTFEGARTLNLFFTTAFYIVDPVMSLLYIAYCDIKIGTPPEKRRRLSYLYCVPLAINLVLALASIWHPLLFNIRGDNVYVRGPLLYVSFFLSYVLLAIAFIRVLYYRRQLVKKGNQTPFLCCNRGMIALVIFPLIPFVGGVIQVWFCPVTVVWLAPVVALLIVFINIQNAEISTDELTGLYNRRQADSYLQSLVQANVKNRPVGLALLDMDNFKQINDHYGHLTGDRALRLMANVLQTECDRDTFYCRYGGDEFVIVTKQKDEAWIDNLLRRIGKRLDESCRAMGAQYTLSISAGVAIWDDEMESVDAFFSTADIRLYQNKSKMGRRAGDDRG